MTPRFRFTLFNAILAPTGLVLVGEEPVGWDKVQISLSRDKTYHSLVEYFKGNFEWYGDAFNLLKTVKNTQGADAEVGVLIEIAYEDVPENWDEIFTGLFDLSQWEGNSEGAYPYKCTVPIIQADFWAKFINLKGTPVDVQSTTSLGGVVVPAVSKIVLNLPTQVIRQRFSRTVNYDPNNTGLLASYTSPVPTNSYIMFDTSRNDLDEIEARMDYGTQISPDEPTDILKYIYKMKYGGVYTFTGSINFALIWNTTVNATIKWYIALRKNGVLTKTQIGVTSSYTGVNAIQGDTKTLNYTDTLAEGDEVYLYGHVDLNTTATMTYFPDYDTDLTGVYAPIYTAFNVVGNTVYKDTETDAMLLFDAAKSVLQQVTDVAGVAVSTFLNGCAGNNALSRGKHIRGYTFGDKEFFLSWQDWWDGADPLYCLGAGYKIIAGNKRIQIENRDYFYNPTAIVNLSNLQINDKVDNEKYFKTIEIGFAKWSAESQSGIDDPQTKRIFRTRFQTIGQDLKILSKFYAASLGIEQTRRNRADQSKDGKTDEDVVLIALKYTGTYEVEVGSDLDSVSGLFNPDSRINIRHSATRLLRRHLPWVSGCLLVGADDNIYFASGEGNYEMASGLTAGDCESDDMLIENLPMSAATTTTFKPVVYMAKDVPMDWATYKLIRENRENALGISRTESGHVACHIIDLDFTIMEGKADILLLLAENADL